MAQSVNQKFDLKVMRKIKKARIGYARPSQFLIYEFSIAD
jgi:hypothetical protein